MCQICAGFPNFAEECPYSGLAMGDGFTAVQAAAIPPGEVLTETGDLPASTATGTTLQSGDVLHGELSFAGDRDWVRVELEAGETYTFAMIGTGALSTGIDDTLLRLRNASGVEIASDDDSGPLRASTLTFTAATTGAYYLEARSFSNTETGTYGLSMITGDRANYSDQMAAGSLLRPDLAWTSQAGTGATVTWGFRANGPAQDASGSPAPFSQLSTPQRAAVIEAMELFDGISGLDFTHVNPSGSTNNATILFANYQSATDGAGAYAWYPGQTAAAANAGDVWLNTQWVSTSSLPPGGWSYSTILHEIGHAVGLAHPGDYNAAPGVSITYANDAQFLQDSQQFTLMSYFDEANTAESFFSHPDTLLLHDILALHQLYGADFSYKAGDTTYGFNATDIGSVFDFTTNSIPFLSIWDGGGRDMLDLSQYNMAQHINLHDGAFSDVGGYSGNVSIAYGAVIEDAAGGSSGDEIIGNDVDNMLHGNAGSDTLRGNDGSDTLLGGTGNDSLYGGDHNDDLSGGEGNDLLDGGDGFDIARYLGSFFEYLVEFVGVGSYSITSARVDDAGVDQVTEIEEVHFAEGVVVGELFQRAVIDDTAGIYDWTSYADTFDLSGGLVRRSMDYDDGRISETVYDDGRVVSNLLTDGADDFDWTTIERFYDASGVITSRTNIYDDGRSLETTYANGVRLTETMTDTADIYGWVNYTDTFDFDGALVARSMTYDNGRLSDTVYDAGRVVSNLLTDGADDFDWTTIEREYDVNGVLTDRTNTYDNGRLLETAYVNGIRSTETMTDTADIFDWTSYTDTFDAGGTLVARSMTYDNGRLSDTVYDAGRVVSNLLTDGADDFDWTTIEREYDVNGVLTARTNTYDDGRLLETAYVNGIRSTETMTDTADIFGWMTYTDTFDLAGNLSTRVLTYDDGSQDVFNY